MSLITIELRLIVAAGRHRQPRTTPSWTIIESEENEPANDYTPGSSFTHIFPGALSAEHGEAVFAFWSVSDTTSGYVDFDPYMSAQVSARPMNVTGWYLPQGGLVGGESEIFVDAFSARTGDFVSDTFVTVTGDPMLTAEANTAGDLPTKVPEPLVAYPRLSSTGEDFLTWFGQDPRDGSVLVENGQVAANLVGIAIAMYLPPRSVPRINRPTFTAEQLIFILGGIINDGPGIVWQPGHVPHPVNPEWGTLVQRVSAAAGLVALGGATRGGAEITKLAIAEVNAAVKDFDAQIGSVRDAEAG